MSIVSKIAHPGHDWNQVSTIEARNARVSMLRKAASNTVVKMSLCDKIRAWLNSEAF